MPKLNRSWLTKAVFYRPKYLKNPYKYWDDIYRIEDRSPFLVLGERGMSKYSVSLNICNHLDDEFSVEKNVIMKIDDEFVKNFEDGVYMFSDADSIHNSYRTFQKRDLTLQSLLATTRKRKVNPCFVTHTGFPIDRKLLSMIYDLVVVQRDFSDEYVAEYLHFRKPVNADVFYHPPKFQNAEELKDYKIKMLKNTETFVTKFKDEKSLLVEFEEKRKRYAKKRTDEMMKRIGEKK